jgi:hypothetical protein
MLYSLFQLVCHVLTACIDFVLQHERDYYTSDFLGMDASSSSEFAAVFQGSVVESFACNVHQLCFKGTVGSLLDCVVALHLAVWVS